MSAAGGGPGAAPLDLSQGPRGQRVKDLAFRAGMLACLAVALITLVALVAQVALKGAGSISGGFFTHYTSSFPENAGIRAALLGTIWLMAVCAAFIIPVGVASAIYLEEYADQDRWYNRFIEVNVQNLASVPSIIYGILGLAFLVRGPIGMGRVVLAGGLTLGLLVLPVVIIAAREAIRAVPPSIREGSVALGATKWQTIWKQVLPAAIPGIATGVILALSRAIGETAPLLMVGAAGSIMSLPKGPWSRYTAVPVQIYDYAKLPSGASKYGVINYQSVAAGGILLLLALLLTMNATAIVIRNRSARSPRG
jgi:phosphate transport system permease protein